MLHASSATRNTVSSLASTSPRYESDMPAFGSWLSDEEIWIVLAYLKGVCPGKIRELQAEITREWAL